MRLLSKCKEIVYQGRCWKCGSLIELTEEEYDNFNFRLNGAPETCPACNNKLMLLPKSVSKFYINEEGVYSRG